METIMTPESTSKELQTVIEYIDSTDRPNLSVAAEKLNKILVALQTEKTAATFESLLENDYHKAETGLENMIEYIEKAWKQEKHADKHPDKPLADQLLATLKSSLENVRKAWAGLRGIDFNVG